MKNLRSSCLSRYRWFRRRFQGVRVLKISEFSMTTMNKEKLLTLAIALSLTAPVFANDSDQPSNREISQKYFHPTRASLSGLRERGLEETGLVAVYPKDATCPQADSFFADGKRGDGSPRNPRFHHGMHAGL